MLTETWHKSNRSHAHGNNCLEAQWQKSSHSLSNGTCLEARKWAKSTRSGPNCDNCVETMWDTTQVHIRDTKDKARGPILTFTPHAWTGFLEGVCAGDYDLPG